MYSLFGAGLIIDARDGGLVHGRDSDEEDIPMLAPVAFGVFQVMGLMQGGEYIVNRENSQSNSVELEEINSYTGSESTQIISIELSSKTRIFNTNGRKGNLFLLIDGGQFIVNRIATSKFYYRLEEINSLTAPEA